MRPGLPETPKAQPKHSEDVVEQEQDSGGVSRGQNQVHVLPEDWHVAASVIEPLLDRLEPATAATQLLVVTNDGDAAAGIASRIATATAERGLRILAATDARRAARVQRSAPAHVIVAPAAAIVELQQSATLKVDGVKAVVLAWVDDLGASATRSLETLMSEQPKDAARIVLASAMSPTVEQLVERYARRARRVQPASSEGLQPVSLSYVTTSDAGRMDALRRILDSLDPESAVIVTRRPESRASVDALLRSLGYGSGHDTIRVAATLEGNAQFVVLFEVPASEEELRKLLGTGASARVVALVTPRQVAALKRLAGGQVSPLALPEAAMRARSREEALRDELRAMLATGQFSRELLALEPLLSEYDGAEVAAAALRLLETERAKPQTASAATGQPPMTRLYLNVGATDNVRPGDLVGAITNEAGISKAELGRVDVRDRHSTVEVATPVANTVVSKLTGVSIRGRRVVARVDEGPERRERPQRPRRDDVRVGSRDTRRKQ